MADGGCAGCLYYYAEFSGEILFSIPLMIRHISLLELQLWLSVVYALCPCRMRRERLIGLQNHANSIYCINHVDTVMACKFFPGPVSRIAGIPDTAPSGAVFFIPSAIFTPLLDYAVPHRTARLTSALHTPPGPACASSRRESLFLSCH